MVSNIETFVPDYLGSKRNAEVLAKKIRAYWAARGEHNYDIRVIKQDLTDGADRPIWVIRSNIQLTFKE